MNDPARRWHPFARTRQEDLTILTAGHETAWWDDQGRPAPWPEDFLNPDAGWTNGTTTSADEQPENDPANPPF